MAFARQSPQVLLPKAKVLAALIATHWQVEGVALTGSLARLEPLVADIDLVVFHDGMIRDGFVSDSLKRSYDESNFTLDGVLGRELAYLLSFARGETPVDYIFVRTDALWDCGYLSQLRTQERHPDFYATVFCQIPLYLLNPKVVVRGRLHKFLFHKDGICGFRWLDLTLQEAHYFFPEIQVRHRCLTPSCQPKTPWEERWRTLRVRKGYEV